VLGVILQGIVRHSYLHPSRLPPPDSRRTVLARQMA